MEGRVYDARWHGAACGVAGNKPSYLLGYVKTDKGDDFLIDHLGNFIIFLKRLGVKHRIQHLAIAFSKEHYDTPYDIKNTDITCIRLY